MHQRQSERRYTSSQSKDSGWWLAVFQLGDVVSVMPSIWVPGNLLTPDLLDL